MVAPVRFRFALVAVFMASCSNCSSQRSDPDEIEDAQPVEADSLSISDVTAPQETNSDGDTPDASPEINTKAPDPYEVPSLVLTQWSLADGPVKRGLARLSYRQGHRKLDAGNLDAAREHFEKAIAIDPSHIRSIGALAVVHMKAKRWEDCLEVSRQCIERAFDREYLGACYYNTGNCLDHLGEHKAALRAYRLSLELRENSITRKEARRLARRLGALPLAKSDRLVKEDTIKRAAKHFLRREGCRRLSFPDDQPGVTVCGAYSVWGELGAYSDKNRQDVLLAISDRRDQIRGGTGILLTQNNGNWREISRTNLLAPGEGGLDFIGNIKAPTGRDIAIFHSSGCHEGCCRGSIRALTLSPSETGVDIRATRLAPIGTSLVGPEKLNVHALVTGSRPIHIDGEQRSSLLLRYETRQGKANPYVSYLRVLLRNGSPSLEGKLPDIRFLPICTLPRSDS